MYGVISKPCQCDVVQHFLYCCSRSTKKTACRSRYSHTYIGLIDLFTPHFIKQVWKFEFLKLRQKVLFKKSEIRFAPFNIALIPFPINLIKYMNVKVYTFNNKTLQTFLKQILTWRLTDMQNSKSCIQMELFKWFLRTNLFLLLEYHL